MKKSRYDIESLEAAWKRLTPVRRSALLGRIGAKQSRFMEGVSWSEVVRTESFIDLPVPVRIHLFGAFDGNRFSRAEQERQEAAIARVLRQSASP